MEPKTESPEFDVVYFIIDITNAIAQFPFFRDPLPRDGMTRRLANIHPHSPAIKFLVFLFDWTVC